MIGDFMQLSGMNGQVLEKHMFDPHPRLPKWEEGYQGMGNSDNWAAYGPWWQTRDPSWGNQPLYSGMGQAGQGSWLGPSQVAPSEVKTGRQMTSHPQAFSLQGLGQAGQGSWLGPSQVAPSELETAAQLVAQRQQWQLQGLGQDAAQGTWLGPSQVNPAELESAAQLVAPHPVVLAAVKAARARRRARGMGDWMELSGIAETVMSPLGILAIGALAYFAWQRK